MFQKWKVVGACGGWKSVVTLQKTLTVRFQFGASRSLREVKSAILNFWLSILIFHLHKVEIVHIFVVQLSLRLSKANILYNPERSARNAYWTWTLFTNKMTAKWSGVHQSTNSVTTLLHTYQPITITSAARMSLKEVMDRGEESHSSCAVCAF